MSGAAQSNSVPSPRPHARRDISASAIAAGLVAVLVSFGGTAVLMVQAGHAAGLNAAQIGSWIGSLSLVLAPAARPTACAPACLSSWPGPRPARPCW